MNKPDDLSSPSVTTAPRVEGVWRRNLRTHPDAERMQGVLDATSPAVQREIERLRAGESGRLPIVAKVPEESKYIILTEAAALAAGKALGLVAPQVHVVNCTSMAHALVRMIELNQAQPKSRLDVATEVYYCHCAQRDLAKERQRDGGGDHRSAAAKAIKAGGTVPSGPAGTDRGETRDIVAKITHQSRANVVLMIGLVEKALMENPKAPRDTEIGRALARPDADLKAIAKEFGVLKGPQAKPSSNSPSDSEPDAASTSNRAASNRAVSNSSTGAETHETGPETAKTTTRRAASSDGTSHTTKTPRQPEPVTAKTLMSLVDHLVSLADNAEVLAASPVAGATKRSPDVESVWMIAFSLFEVALRLMRSVPGVEVDIPSQTRKLGAAASRDFLLRRMVMRSKSLRRAITAELGVDGGRIVEDLCAERRDIDPRLLLAMLRALVAHGSSKA